MIVASVRTLDDVTSAARTMKMTRSLVEKKNEGGLGFEVQMFCATIEPKTAKEKKAADKYVKDEMKRMRDLRKQSLKGVPFRPSANLLLFEDGSLTDFGHSYWALRGMKPDDLVPYIGIKKSKAFFKEAMLPKNFRKVEAWRSRREAKVLKKYGTWQAFFEALQNDPYIKSLKPIKVTARTKITFSEAKARQQKVMATHRTTKEKMAYPGGLDGFWKQLKEDDEVLNSIALSLGLDNMYSPSIEKALNPNVRRPALPVTNLAMQDVVRHR